MRQRFTRDTLFPDLKARKAQYVLGTKIRDVYHIKRDTTE